MPTRPFTSIPDARHWSRSYVAGAVGLFTLLVFLPSVACGFINWDDGPYVYNNPVVLGGLSWGALKHACTSTVFHNWAPLVIVSYQIDASLFGLAPWGFHLTNVLFHAASATVLFTALDRMTGCRTRSLVAALIWAVHPLRVESVAWVAERKDVLSVFFIVLSILAYECYCRRGRAFYHGLVMLAMLGSLLCKATAVTLPVLLVLLDVWPLRRVVIPRVGDPDPGRKHAPRYPGRSWRGAIMEKVPLTVMACVFAGVTILTQVAAIQADAEVPMVAARVPNAIYAINWYAWKTVWPFGLYPFHSHVGTELSPPMLGLCAGSLLAVVATAWWLAPTDPVPLWGTCWFLVALLPVLGFVQTGFQGHADRFTYVPHIGLVVALVWVAFSGARRLRLPTPVVLLTAALCIALGAVGSVRQIAMWKNPDALWGTMLRLDPANAMASLKYANHLVATRRLQEAEPRFIAAIEHSKDDWVGRVIVITSVTNLAYLYCDLGDLERAAVMRDRAVAIAADDPTVQAMARQLEGRIGQPRRQ